MANFMIFMAIMVATATMQFYCTAAQTRHLVGDALGWTVPPGGAAAYTSWASVQNFTVGDSLVFNFTGGLHDVAEVSAAAYDPCTATNPISLTTTTPATLTLTTAGPHYYICTFTSHCQIGQKLTINVSAAATATPPSMTPASPPATTVTPPPTAATPPSMAPASPPATTPTPPPTATTPPSMAPSSPPATTPTPPPTAATPPSTTPVPSPTTTPSPTSSPNLSPPSPPTTAATPPGSNLSPTGSTVPPPPPTNGAPSFTAVAPVTFLAIALAFLN